jgi:hypothetical protein
MGGRFQAVSALARDTPGGSVYAGYRGSIRVDTSKLAAGWAVAKSSEFFAGCQPARTVRRVAGSSFVYGPGFLRPVRAGPVDSRQTRLRGDPSPLGRGLRARPAFSAG